MRGIQEQRGREFTLEELIGAVESTLSSLGGESLDARINARPDTRTIRYYQSAGLLTKPLRYDGRKAIYGYHHLLQLVCIKQLQIEGYSLSVIQRALLGQSEGDLEKKLVALSTVQSSSREPAPPTPPTSPTCRSSLSLEIVPGMTITLDTDRFADPRKTISEIASALTRLLEKKL
jgi:DNA-binding transcriptional MerR regulator